MSTLDPSPPIASVPVHAPLRARTGTHHVMVADGEGAGALLDIATSLLMSRTGIVYIPRALDLSQNLSALRPSHFHRFASYDEAAPHLRDMLSNAKMGVQVYLAGSEGLIGQAYQVAMQAGVPRSAIQSERRGATGRRVQCIHCKAFRDDVRTSRFTCAGCGRTLMVRDHYSRRLAAYMGVCAEPAATGRPA